MALRQLSAIYLTAASAYTVGMLLSQHPVFAKHLDETGIYLGHRGAEAAVAMEDRVIAPARKIAGEEVNALMHRVEFALTAAKHEYSSVRSRIVARTVGSYLHPRSLLPNRATKPERGFAALTPSRLLRDDETGLRGGIDVNRPVPPAASEVPGTLASSVPDENTPPPRVAATDRASTLQLVPQIERSVPQPDTTPRTASPIPGLPPPNPAELVRVEQRLKDNLTSEMLANFELFLYVSKAEKGPWAQHMYVFRKDASGDLNLMHNWPVSTGRERIEFNAAGQELPSFTPSGYYEIDPKRSFVHYRSVQWGHEMPYAMFFNWQKNGRQTGLAIHSATGDDIGLLGTRASAGCVRLAPEAARTLFTLIRTQYRGLAPRFAIDRRTGTMSSDGIILRDAGGQVQLAEGYKVLVFIENFGGENVVAALF